MEKVGIVKSTRVKDNLPDQLRLTGFVGKSPTSDYAKRLQQDQTMSDFYIARYGLL